MKKIITTAAAVAGMLLASTGVAQAQEDVFVAEEVITEQQVECKDHYSSSWRDNWYIQLGAGMHIPYVDKASVGNDYQHHITAIYNLGIGHWFSPYLGFRFSGYYGKAHYETSSYNSMQMGALNFDLQWDMLNSLAGVNPNRVFSIIPYFGVGGMYTWDHKGAIGNIPDGEGHIKTKEWMLPVSAGVQLRFRLAKNVDFFAEARGMFVADNFNSVAVGDPIECDFSVIGGFSFTFGEGRKFDSYNPCTYLSYINNLNGQVNNLRGELATTSAALAEAQAQLPCPEVVQEAAVVQAPLMSTVRFRINSARITSEEEVNVYNTAEWMKANPGTTVVVQGFADKDTGTSSYNMELSQRRCQAVVDQLTKKYGIDPGRLVMKANGSDVQPYEVNDWNRIVIFTQPM